MPPKRHYVRRCIVTNCSNTSSNATLFRLPKDEQRCSIWLKNCNRLDLAKFSSEHLYETYRVCGSHFGENMFAGHFSSIFANKLKRNAVPTIFSGSEDIHDLTRSNQNEYSKTSEYCHSTSTSLKYVPGTTSDCQEIQTRGSEDTHYLTQSNQGESSKTLEYRHSTPTALESLPGTSDCQEIQTRELEDILDLTESNQGESSKSSEYYHSTPASLEYLPGTSDCQVQTQDYSSQTPSSLSWDSPRKRDLRRKVRRLTYEKAHMESKSSPNRAEVIAYLRQYLSDSFIKLLETHLDLHQKHPQGYRYCNEHKQFALTIYFLGPNVYKYLANMFHLPSKSTLYRITQNWNISAGFNNVIFSIVQSRVNTMTDIEKNCILCIDEMSIKKFLFYNNKKDVIVGFHETMSEKKYEPAKSVLVVMARGLFCNWKQPLVYFFVNTICSKEISKILYETVTRLQNIDMKVRAVVSDQGSNFMQFVKKTGISPEKPYFIVNNEKIFYFLDVPHLIKSTRNNFFKYSLVFPDGTAQKKNVEMFYNNDKHLPLRLAPKLTDEHIYIPTALKK